MPFSVGEIIMFLNIFILSSSGFVFGWDKAMYSLIAYYIAFKMIDITIEGFEESKSVWIISERYREIGDALLHRLGRGVTYLNGEGAFTGDDKKVIFVVITRLEEAKLKSIVDDWDPHAFLAVGNIHDVKGGRFKRKTFTRASRLPNSSTSRRPLSPGWRSSWRNAVGKGPAGCAHRDRGRPAEGGELLAAGSPGSG
ncbi:YitT family protein [Paenibacillus sp. CC-CFT747]|nr:YitT family protein [Paenibacillus sp. CC-CFT747]